MACGRGRPVQFPLANRRGMSTGALVTGTQLCSSLASDTPYMRLNSGDFSTRPGLPPGCLQLRDRAGGHRGPRTRRNEEVNGFVPSPASRKVGLPAFKTFTRTPPQADHHGDGRERTRRSSRRAPDLEKAAIGVMRRRLRVRGPEVLRMFSRPRRPHREGSVPRATRVGTQIDQDRSPTHRDVYLGPVITTPQ